MQNHKGRYAAPRKPRTRSIPFYFAALAVGGLLLVGACADTEAQADADEPEPEVVTETVEVEVATVPQSCLDALDHGERLADAMDWTLDWVGEYLSAVADLDTFRMEELNGELTSQTDSGTFTGVLPDFEYAAQQCRAES